jgi:hypothetical protein
MTYVSKDSAYAEETSLESGTRDGLASRRCYSHGRSLSKTFKIMLAIPILTVTVL